MSKLSDLSNGALIALLSAVTLSKPVLAINIGGAATVKTTAAIAYAINGVSYSKAALAAQSIAVTHNANGSASAGYVQPAGTTVYYTLGVNAAGTVSVSQSTYVAQAGSSNPAVGVGAGYQSGTSFIGSGNMADAPDGYAPFGLIKVVTAGAATFTAGTTVLDAANVTASYFDLFVVPATNL